MYRSFISGIVASTLGVISAIPVTGHALCRPTLNVTGVQFSEMMPPTLERKWTAFVSLDTSHCATTSCRFTISFSRLKETAPDLEFKEQFTWSPSSGTVSLELWADEAVERYWLSDVAACPCHD
jgi:hypothetical protein